MPASVTADPTVSLRDRESYTDMIREVHGRGHRACPPTAASQRAAAITGCLALCIATAAAAADLLDDVAARAVARCESIAPDRGQTAMIFNPRDRQTVWERSECFQALAATLRDGRHCEFAVERESRLFDGTGVSPIACRRALDARRASDRDEAARIPSPQRVVDASIVRNGNGRDVDLTVRTTGGYAHRYTLRAALVGPDGDLRPLLSIPQPLGPTESTLVHLVPGDRYAAALAGPPAPSAKALRVELALAATTLDERAIFALLPVTVRESAILRPLPGPAKSR